MLTDDDIAEQMAIYFGWLDTKLDDAGGAPRPRHDHARSRRGLLAVAAAAGLIVVLVGGLLWSSSEEPDRSVVIDAPVTTPTTTIADLAVENTEGIGVDPAMLPNGVFVWDVANGVSSMNEALTMQLFAEPTLVGERIARGVIVTVSPGDPIGVDSPVPTTAVRGHAGLLVDDDVLVWVEHGVSLEARSKGLSVDETIAVLDDLVFRADPVNGLEPGPGSAFTLMAETAHGPDRIDTRTFFRLGPPDQIPGTYEITADNEPPHVMIGTGFGLAAPEVLLYGQPQPDGTIESPMLAYGLDDPRYARYRINDDASVTMVFADTSAKRAAIMNATRPMSGKELETIFNDISVRLGDLPDVAAQSVGDIGIVVRGGSINDPTALCVDTRSATNCRLVFPVLVAGGVTIPMTQVTAGDQTYIVGVQTNGPAIAVVEWQPGLPDTLPIDLALPTANLTTDDGTTYSATQVPTDIDATVIATITDDEIRLPNGNQSGSPRLTTLG